MVGCLVFGCKSNNLRKEAGVTFHAFPKDDETCKKWIAVTGKKNWVPSKYSRICSKHFEQHCFRKTQKLTFIEKFSIPTLFIHNVPVPEVDPKDGLSMDMDRQNQPNVSWEKYPKFPASHEVQVEPFPTEFVDCQSHFDTHAQQHRVTTESKFPVSHEVRVEPLPTESMDCQSQPDTYAQQHSVTAKSIECAKSSNKSMPRTEDPIITPRKFKLTLQLNRQTLLAESRRKKIEALRSKSRRLQKKNAELSAIIEDLKPKDS